MGLLINSDVDNRIKMTRGDTHAVNMTFEVPTEEDPKVLEPVDITGATIVFTVRMREMDTTIILQKSGFVVDGPTGKLRILVDPVDTQAKDPGSFTYDVEITLASGARYTLVRDGFILEPDVTHAEDTASKYVIIPSISTTAPLSIDRVDASVVNDDYGANFYLGFLIDPAEIGSHPIQVELYQPDGTVWSSGSGTLTPGGTFWHTVPNWIQIVSLTLFGTWTVKVFLDGAPVPVRIKTFEIVA